MTADRPEPEDGPEDGGSDPPVPPWADHEGIKPLPEIPSVEDGPEPMGDHQNPYDVADVSDEWRAGQLRRYLDRLDTKFGVMPKLMPLDNAGKGPIIAGNASLDSERARRLLVDGDEAVRLIREESARGFCIYAGKPDHNTTDLLLVDVDDRLSFPYEAFGRTLYVMSGSGRGDHLSFRNGGDVQNAAGKDGVDGEIRAKNWYCVTPGSVHPSGGVYHIIDDREIATLCADDIPLALQPGMIRTETATGGRDNGTGGGAAGDPVPVSPAQADAEAELPNDETIINRLERAFENPHDGKRMEHVYNGRYAKAGFDDRSSAEFWFANRVDSWVGFGDRSVVAQVMDNGTLHKWSERGSSYRNATLKNVGYQDWYYDFDGSGNGGASADPTAVLPLEQIDALWRKNPEQAKRYARKQGKTWPTTNEVRAELFEMIRAGMAGEETVTIDAPTSAGKSYTIAATCWLEYADVTGGQPVVQLHATCDARDEAIEDSKAAGVDYAVVRNRKEVCPVCAGEYDPTTDPEEGDDEDDSDVVLTVDGVPVSEWIDRACGSDTYPGWGLAASVAHAYVAANNDQGIDLPCEANESECRLQTQWDGIPRTDDGDAAVDVIHATHPFAYVPSLRQHTNVVFDEQPDFSVELSTDRLQRAVGAFLREVGAPAESWEAFVTLARHDGFETDAALERDAIKKAIEKDPGREWFLSNPDAHTLAPALARATWYALSDEPDANGRLRATVAHEPPRLDAGVNPDAGWNREWVTVVLSDDRGRVEVETIRDAPDLSQARSIIGLDAHPSMPLWQRNARPTMERRAVLNPADRALWRRFERGLTVVQLGDATRPAGKDGQYLRYDGNDGADPLRVVIDYLREHYGEDFNTGITAKKAEDYFEEAMRACGIRDPETMHFGEEKSRNDFRDELVGLVNGCIDPGDGYVVDLLAECGLDARPATEICGKCDGEGCADDPNCDDGERRAKGREFVGPDADAAAELLASVRENHVAQATGRYARNPDDPDSRAVVFVRTDATPPGFVDYHAPDVAWAFTDTQRAIIETVADADYTGTTAKAIAEATGVSKPHVRDTLQRLTDEGRATVREGAGDYGADVFRVVDAPTFGLVDLPTQIANTPVWESYTWSFSIQPADRPSGQPPSANGGDSVATDDPATTDGGGGHDPPPS